jgi:hypothetical protein
MTISSTGNRKAYTGNGVTRAFSFPYPLLVKADLLVYEAGVLKTLDSRYTITGSPTNGPWPNGVTVTFFAPAAPPANGASVILLRDPALSQNLDLVENDDFPVESVEQSLDRLTMIAQRLAERVDRSFELADTDISGASTTLATPAASTMIGWNSAGTALQNYSKSDLGADVLLTPFAESLLDDADAATARATLDASATTPPDNVFAVVGSSDATKKVRFEVDGLTTATTRVLTVPDADATLGSFADSSDATKKVAFGLSGITTGTTRTITVADRDIAIGKYPTRQILTSGSGTYTTPSGCIYIKVRMIGGGGGGAGSGSGTVTGGNGGNTTFSTLTAAGGNGCTGSTGAGGGAGTNGDVNITGSSGGSGANQNNTPGGAGGSSVFGCAGAAGAVNAGAGGAASTNSGSGGGGAGQLATSSAGGGGGGGAYVEKLISGPSATYSYAVGAAGTAGSAGTGGAAGGAGGSGIIIVDEFYQ